MPTANVIVPCGRCGVRLRVAAEQNPAARLMKRSLGPDGLCVNCAASSFFYSVEQMRQNIDRFGADLFRLLHIQQQFAELMRVGCADARPEEIDWEHVIANWSLPFPATRRTRRKGSD